MVFTIFFKLNSKLVDIDEQAENIFLARKINNRV